MKVLDFAANTYGQMTDGFIREDLKSLRKAVSSTNDEKDILKKIRRKETLSVCIDKLGWKGKLQQERLRVDQFRHECVQRYPLFLY